MSLPKSRLSRSAPDSASSAASPGEAPEATARQTSPLGQLSAKSAARILLPLSLGLMLCALVVAGRELLSEQLAPEAPALDAAAVSDSPVPTKDLVPATPESILQGHYVGWYFPGSEVNGEHVEGSQAKAQYEGFGAKLNLTISQMGRGRVQGYAMMLDAKRPFAGSYTRQAAGSYKIEVAEPGNSRRDGVFSFTLTPPSREVKGSWAPKLPGSKKPSWDFELKPQAFKYDPTLMIDPHVLHPLGAAEIPNTYNPDSDKSESLTADAIKFNTSTQKLTSADVENLYKRDLEILRQTIYARHGQAFADPALSYLFGQVEWYVPVSQNVDAELSAIELANIDLLQRYEQHADKYYAHFGR